MPPATTLTKVRIGKSDADSESEPEIGRHSGTNSSYLGHAADAGNNRLAFVALLASII